MKAKIYFILFFGLFLISSSNTKAVISIHSLSIIQSLQPTVVDDLQISTTSQNSTSTLLTVLDINDDDDDVSVSSRKKNSIEKTIFVKNNSFQLLCFRNISFIKFCFAPFARNTHFISLGVLRL